MAAYRMQGTPTLLLIDRSGRLRQQIFGHVPDLQSGAEIMQLLLERSKESDGGPANRTVVGRRGQ
jgi:thioredoxin-related protein